MSTAIQVGGQLQLGTVDTPLDARVRIESLSAVGSISLPYVGMTFYAKSEGKLYVVKSLKNHTVGHTVVTNGEVDQYEEVGTDLELLEQKIAESAAKPATITLPIPYDADYDNLLLVVDFSKDGNFSGDPGSGYTRVKMSEKHSKMKLFSDDKWIACPSSIGLAYYGGSVSFTLDTELVPDYKPGTKYFARYCWVDEHSDPADWKGFAFTGDVADFVPVRTGLLDEPRIKNLTGQSSTIELDYHDAEIFNIELSGNLTITTSSVKNLTRGEMMLAHIKANGHTLTAGTTTYSPTGGNMVVGFVNLGNSISIICAETVN